MDTLFCAISVQIRGVLVYIPLSTDLIGQALWQPLLPSPVQWDQTPPISYPPPSPLPHHLLLFLHSLLLLLLLLQPSSKFVRVLHNLAGVKCLFTTGGTSKQDISGASPITQQAQEGHSKWLIRSSLQTCLCSHQEERDPWCGLTC